MWDIAIQIKIVPHRFKLTIAWPDPFYFINERSRLSICVRGITNEFACALPALPQLSDSGQ